MTRKIALHCMKSASELERELCEECLIYGQTGCDHCFEDALQYVIGMLEQEPKWIPVTKRLPEEDGEYLATIYDMDENHEYMDIAELEDGKWCYKPYILVKAWIPLPEPYKEENKE